MHESGVLAYSKTCAPNGFRKIRSEPSFFTASGFAKISARGLPPDKSHRDAEPKQRNGSRRGWIVKEGGALEKYALETFMKKESDEGPVSCKHSAVPQIRDGLPSCMVRVGALGQGSPQSGFRSAPNLAGNRQFLNQASHTNTQHLLIGACRYAHIFPPPVGEREPPEPRGGSPQGSAGLDHVLEWWLASLAGKSTESLCSEGRGDVVHKGAQQQGQPPHPCWCIPADFPDTARSPPSRDPAPR